MTKITIDIRGGASVSPGIHKGGLYQTIGAVRDLVADMASDLDELRATDPDHARGVAHYLAEARQALERAAVASCVNAPGREPMRHAPCVNPPSGYPTGAMDWIG